jgi:cholesterol transport system auxiliary component
MTSANTLHRAVRRGIVLALAALGGCGILPDVKTPTDLYTLSPKTTFDAGLPNVYWQLVVETPIAAAGLNTGRINVATTPLSTDYYATSAWTDRAPLMVQTLLIESFENTRRIVAVGRDTNGLRGNYVLQTELREFQAETYHGPKPIVRVRLNVKIVRMPERQIIGSRTIERCSEAANDQVPAVVQAFDDALGAVLKRTVSWVLTTPPPRADSQDDAKLVERFRDPANLVTDVDRCPSGGGAVAPAAKPKS